jgi:hypothetical protein
MTQADKPAIPPFQLLARSLEPITHRPALVGTPSINSALMRNQHVPLSSQMNGSTIASSIVTAPAEDSSYSEISMSTYS